MAQRINIITYHYVRNISQSRYPNVKGLEASEFRKHLEAFTNVGEVIIGSDVVGALKGEFDLPENVFWLTFDDGYSDHYETVFPLLDEFRVSGTFFPPTKCLRDLFLLDVNAVHFILACAKDPAKIVSCLQNILNEKQNCYSLKSFEDYWKENAFPNRFDTAEVIFLKRMLQHALPPAIRRSVIDVLFAEFVSVDQSAFAEDLYMTCDQIRLMQRAGMEFGSHTDSHPWLDKISEEQQRSEIKLSLDFFSSVGLPMEDWPICYPYGASDKNTHRIAREFGAALGLSTKVGAADMEKDELMSLPRWDANDVESLLLELDRS